VLVLLSLGIPVLIRELVVSSIAQYTEFCTLLFLYNQGSDESKLVALLINDGQKPSKTLPLHFEHLSKDVV
jgi:hypothetical protein